MSAAAWSNIKLQYLYARRRRRVENVLGRHAVRAHSGAVVVAYARFTYAASYVRARETVAALRNVNSHKKSPSHNNGASISHQHAFVAKKGGGAANLSRFRHCSLLKLHFNFSLLIYGLSRTDSACNPPEISISTPHSTHPDKRVLLPNTKF